MMSKFVEELIQDLKQNPTTYKDYFGTGVSKDNIVISGYGNTRVFSIISVEFDFKRIPTSYIDNWRLEVAIKDWYKNATIQMLKN